MTVAAISIFLVSYQSAFLRAKIQIKSNITKKQKNFFEKGENDAKGQSLGITALLVYQKM
jgi:hypothetical protein